MRDTVIYIYPHLSSFIRKDINFLSEKYEVRAPDHNWRNKFLIPFTFLRQFFYLLSNLPHAKAVFVMFGGYWSFLPALLGKLFRTPVFIILGGTDCVSFPKMNYGNLRKPLLRSVISASYKMSTRLLPVHESLVKKAYTYSDKSSTPEQGYLAFIPDVKTPVKTIYNGFDGDFFEAAASPKKPLSFITVAPVNSVMRFELKGIDKVFELAKKFPQASFTIIGLSEEVKARLKEIPKNVTTFPFLNQEELIRHLQESECYLQLSVSEGFPNALCEAMLCNCIPVGSAVGAIPFIIADTGFVMERDEINYLVSRFGEIMALDENAKKLLAEKARRRVVEEFPIEKRREQFLKILSELK